MAILDELRRERGMALLFITHDLELAGAVCDRTSRHVRRVRSSRRARARKLHDDPLHPVHRVAGRRARPTIDASVHRLTAIPGRPVSAFEAPDGCPFAPRCAFAQDRCRARRGRRSRSSTAALVRCIRATELRGRLVKEVVRHG